MITLAKIKKDWVILIGIPILFCVSYFYNYLPFAGFEFCAIKNVVRIPCPGCGLTKSFVAFTHGKIIESFKFNLVGPILVCILMYIFAKKIIEIALNKQFSPLIEPQKRFYVAIALTVVLFLQWIVKFLGLI